MEASVEAEASIVSLKPSRLNASMQGLCLGGQVLQISNASAGGNLQVIENLMHNWKR